MFLNRLINPPLATSREMRAYMGAILEVTGMMSGQGFPLQKFMRNFATHMSPKAGFPHATLRQGSDGLVYVTPKGWEYFSSRLTDKPITRGQRVGRREIVEMIRCIVAPSPPAGWQSFEVEVDENQG